MPLGTVAATTLRLPAAELGPPSPLPAFAGLQRLPDPALSADLPDDLRARMAYGRLASPLPYAIQNGYGRTLAPRELPTIRLANDRLEASVLPGLGGRVWSLRDRRTNAELVFPNPRMQFANFGLTDAWCAGGIEWNLGSTGHSATTSRPVFAGRVATDRGEVLRIWEWERTRDLVFSVDLMLAPGAAALLVFARVRNLDPEPKPLYWWTNVAVAERAGTRVLAPADRAWRTAYDGSIESVAMPYPDAPEVGVPGMDVSYPLTAGRAADYFFQIPANRRHWVAAVQADGSGLAQTSTAEMLGRKFFLWGAGAGGDRWQEWLNGPGRRYVEIQAGLATTQLEHLQIGGGSELTWAEAYVPLTAESVGADPAVVDPAVVDPAVVDPAAAHGSWMAAVQSVQGALDTAIPAHELDQWHAWWRSEVADLAPAEQLAAGSGAGQAELTVRGLDPGTPQLAGTPFDSPADDEFRHLLTLARGGQVDQDAAGAELFIPPVSDRWADAFERAADGWWTRLMRAVRAHAVHAVHSGGAEAGAGERAADLYRASVELHPTPWALRGLALLAADRGAPGEAVGHYGEAVRLAPDCVPLLVEATELVLQLGRPQECLAWIDAAPDRVRRTGRVELQRCRGLLAAGRSEEARTLAENLEVADLREGETLGEVWRAAYPDEPLPARYDFRMAPHSVR